MGQKERAMMGKNRIMIYEPKDDGTYIVEFRTAAGEALAISIPANASDSVFPRAYALWAIRAGRGSNMTHSGASKQPRFAC
jgi:hypothetical protein